MKTYLYQLRFKGPIHFGATGIGLEKSLEYLSSDSIYSALINTFNMLGNAGEVIEALQKEQPCFLLSSLYPFGPVKGWSGPVHAFPRPFIKPLVDNPEIFSDLGKDLKRIRYLTLDDFLTWIRDQPLTITQVKDIIDRSGRLAGQWNQREETGWYVNELRPRVALDRTTQNSNIWSCGAVHFHPEAGLFGLAKITDETWVTELSKAFKLLGQNGLGGERTYGMGFFEFSGFKSFFDNRQPLNPNEFSQLVLLSRYYPAESERFKLRETLKAWEFVQSRGYVVSGRLTTTVKRKRLWMISEGTVLNKPVKGQLVNVSPDHSADFGLNHPVYRSGLAFYFPEVRQ